MPGKRYQEVYLQGFKEPTWRKKGGVVPTIDATLRRRLPSTCRPAVCRPSKLFADLSCQAQAENGDDAPEHAGDQDSSYQPRDGKILCLGEREEGCFFLRRKYIQPRNLTDRYPRNDGLWKMYGSGEPNMVSFWVSIYKLCYIFGGEGV